MRAEQRHDIPEVSVLMFPSLRRALLPFSSYLFDRVDKVRTAVVRNKKRANETLHAKIFV